ncbi:MAG: hypothetical protein C0618_00305 [Desulfuromonas sp.]|nr:MAG: hypothetical protein C0618_00305 [Desulfuromonas sp.]
MRTSSTKQKSAVLAVPYYGQLVRHNGGLEHIYFRLNANPVTGELTKSELCVWDQKNSPSLPEWLDQNGIRTLLCSDKRPGLESLFTANGIHVFWEQSGEISEMVNHWMSSSNDNWKHAICA